MNFVHMVTSLTEYAILNLMKPTSIAAIIVIAASLAFTAIPGAAHADGDCMEGPPGCIHVADDRDMNTVRPPISDDRDMNVTIPADLPVIAPAVVVLPAAPYTGPTLAATG